MEDKGRKQQSEIQTTCFISLLENVSQALFVVTGGERTHPKPIWLCEPVPPRTKSALCLLAVQGTEMYFSACLPFHTKLLLFVDVSARGGTGDETPRVLPFLFPHDKGHT